MGAPGSQAQTATHRGARQTLQTSEAAVSFQSPLTSLSSFPFVTSGALRALGMRQTQFGAGWAGVGALCWPQGSQRVPGSAGPLSPPKPAAGHPPRTLRYSLQFPGLQLVLRDPWGLVHPMRQRTGAVSEQSQGWPSSASAPGWPRRLLLPQPGKPALGTPPGPEEEGRSGESPPLTQPPSCTAALTE